MGGMEMAACGRVLFLLLAAFLAAGSCTLQAAERPLKIGFIYVGPIGDVGWSYSQEVSRQQLVQEYPYVETITVANVSGGDAEKVMRDLIDQGVNAIFATSYDHGAGVETLAEEFPGIHFFYCSGESSQPNVSTYFGRMYEGMYLVGAIAAATSRAGIIGYIGPKVIPETRRIFNSFVLGARSINPKVVIKTVWTGKWYAPKESTALAEILIEDGVDMLFNGDDSAAAFRVVMEKNISAVGYYTDVSRFAPMSILASSAWDWTVFYDEIIPKLRKGTWSKADLWWGVNKGALVLNISEKSVPAAVVERIRKLEAGLKSGEIVIFKGPLSDSSGVLQVAEGKQASDQELLSMDWVLLKAEPYSPVRP